MVEPEEITPPAPRRHKLRQVAGWLCIVLAVVGTLIPVLPQIPFLAVGAILLAPYVRLFRRISAWVHKKYPRTRPHTRRFRIFKRPWRPVVRLPPEPETPTPKTDINHKPSS